MRLEARRKALLVLRDRWLCAVLRAELLERGWEATCGPSLGVVLVLRADETPADVILIEQAALSERDRRVVEALAAIPGGPALVLLAGATVEPASGPWDRVVKRPTSLDALVEALSATAPRRTRLIPCPSFAVRLGEPWPMIRCELCRTKTTRHYEMPRNDEEWAAVRVDLPKFILEHAK